MNKTALTKTYTKDIQNSTAGITQINDSVAQIDQTTKDNVEIANESAIILVQ